MHNQGEMFRIMHTNDMHGTMDENIFQRLSELRVSADFYFDSGDSIKTGNLGIPLKPDAVWTKFKQLQLTASVLGNRETHPTAHAAAMKTQGADHPILVGNMTDSKGNFAYPRSKVFEVRGLRIGVFGVMVPMATEKMKTRFAWSSRWQSPILAANEIATELRRQCDLVVALTHIGHQQDVRLANECPSIDIILGGHSHTILTEPQQVGNTWICQGGSHNRYAGLYEWDGSALRGELVPLKS